MLPILLHYTRIGNEVHAREYAAGFLIGIAMRPDGQPAVLEVRGDFISDRRCRPCNPGGWRRHHTFLDCESRDDQTSLYDGFGSRNTELQTPQDRGLDMVGLLLGLSYGSSDPGTLKPVLDFMHRDDLTANTRRELVHRLGTANGLPEPVNQSLLKELDDPDPTVRVAAVVALRTLQPASTRWQRIASRRWRAIPGRTRRFESWPRKRLQEKLA